MSRPVRLLATFAAVAALLATLAASAPAAAVARAITLEYTDTGVLLALTDSGTTIRTSSAPGAVISPGSYQVIFNNDMPDSRDIQHAFRLQGPGVNLQTDMSAGDDKTQLYDVVLAPSGVYTFADDRQPSVPHVVFSTASTASAVPNTSGGTSGGSSSGTSSNSSFVGADVKTVPFRGNLAASVAGGGTLRLTAGGSKILKLLEGRYRITVDDRTAKAGFTVQELGKRALALTGVAFVGRRKVLVTFKAGHWMYYSPTGAKSSFTVVS
jgi:hypothetical protein